MLFVDSVLGIASGIAFAIENFGVPHVILEFAGIVTTICVLMSSGITFGNPGMGHEGGRLCLDLLLAVVCCLLCLVACCVLLLAFSLLVVVVFVCVLPVAVCYLLCVACSFAAAELLVRGTG